MAVLALSLLTLVLAFAQLNTAFRVIEAGDVWTRYYSTFLTLAFFQHDHFQISGHWGMLLVVLQHLNTMLLFIVYFPLLAGRLAIFDGDSVPPQTHEVTLRASTRAEWKIVRAGREPANNMSGESLILHCDKTSEWTWEIGDADPLPVLVPPPALHFLTLTPPQF